MDTLLTARKLIELRGRLDSLKTEFGHWRDESEATKPLEKHHTQIRRVTAQLAGLQGQLQASLDADGAAQGILADGKRLEEQILSIHTIWEFFRSKLIQRREEWFAPYLRACDEFAWACYRPAQERFDMTPGALPAGTADSRKEPPLVFLNSGWSPFVVSRDQAFQPDRADGGWLATESFQEVIQRLPIPVIGLPWYQVAHLPDVLVVGHEVGHAVERDFGLMDSLEAALAAVNLPEPRDAAWREWLREVFADVYGCLAGGPAFAGALLDFLAEDKTKIAHEKRSATKWTRYPTATLRIQLCARVLEQTEFATQAQDLTDQWTATYGTEHAMAEFGPDVGKVAAAILTATFPTLGGSALMDVFSFTADQEKRAQVVAKQAQAQEAVSSRDPRVLVAAARWLYEQDPAAYVDCEYDGVLRRAIVAGTPGGTRGPRGQRNELDQTALVSQDVRDEAAGVKLFQDLFRAS